jgi:hypothetical protein
MPQGNQSTKPSMHTEFASTGGSPAIQCDSAVR